MQLSAAVARGVRQIASDLKVSLVVVYSQTGATARIFSKLRFPVIIVALSSDHRALRRMGLHYGVLPLEMAPPQTMNDLVSSVDQLIQEKKLANPGQRICIVAGASLGTPGTLNGIVIHTVGEPSVESIVTIPVPAEARE
jgi:pyruvate kinase